MERKKLEGYTPGPCDAERLLFDGFDHLIRCLREYPRGEGSWSAAAMRRDAEGLAEYAQLTVERAKLASAQAPTLLEQRDALVALVRRAFKNPCLADSWKEDAERVLREVGDGD